MFIYLWVIFIAGERKYKEIIHQLDVWHKSKKLDSKLTEVGRNLCT